MASNEYHFTTHWRVRASPEAVYDILEDPTALPDWWPAVYLDVTEVNGEHGEHEHGDDSVYDLFTTGWLPYTLRWRAIPGGSERPRRIELDARGDLAGYGVWTLTPVEDEDKDGAWTDVTYDWDIRAEKPLLRRFSWLVRPVFAANHRWATATGEQSLRRELARRRATTADGRARVADPPEPTLTSTVRGIVLGALVIGFVAYLLSRRR